MQVFRFKSLFTRSMSSSIGAKLNIKCIIGCNPKERITPQTIQVTMSVQIDTLEACVTDDVSKTISYSHLAKIASETALKGKYLLLERLAYEIYSRVYSQYPQITSANVKIAKTVKRKKYFVNFDF